MIGFPFFRTGQAIPHFRKSGILMFSNIKFITIDNMWVLIIVVKDSVAGSSRL